MPRLTQSVRTGSVPVNSAGQPFFVQRSAFPEERRTRNEERPNYLPATPTQARVKKSFIVSPNMMSSQMNPEMTVTFVSGVL